MARTRISIRDADRELRDPTYNLALLRDAAEATASIGGAYHDLEELPAVLDKLLATDTRRRVERPVRYDIAARQPWLLLALAVGALALEWALRKRMGLA